VFTEGLVTPGDPGEVLLRSARALRRLGARITRYDAEAGTLEARTRRWRLRGLVRLDVADDGDGGSRVTIETDYTGGWLLAGRAATWTIRRFRSELAAE
jgi:hypothetical protein